MYSLVGVSNVLKNIYKLTYNYLDSKTDINLRSLRIAIKKYLLTNNPQLCYSDQLTPSIVQNGYELEIILDVHGLRTEIDTNIQEDNQLNLSNLKKINSAIDRMSSLEDIYSLFFLGIDTIGLTTNIRFPGSATTPDTIGLMWIQPDKSWTELDILESLIHELTHTLLGFDNLVYKHYDNLVEIMNQETWVPSAIRKEKRPVNGVAHSIIVGIEILKLRKRLNIKDSEVTIHGSFEELLEKTLFALKNLISNQKSWNILSSRMQELLNLADFSLQHLLTWRNQSERFLSRI